MNKQELLKNLKENTYCRLGPSEIHRVGVFAIRDIPKGINPFIGTPQYNYIEFDKEELTDLDPNVKDMINAYFILEDGKIQIPDCGLNGIDISFFANHSDNPNIKTTDSETFTTLREIKVGEELTFNYNEDHGQENGADTKLIE